MSDKSEAKCPKCGGEFEVYSGENPYKIGTGFCRTDGRVKLPPAPGLLARLGKSVSTGR